MIRITNLKIDCNHSREALEKKLLHALFLKKEDVAGWQIVKQSIDARKKPEIYFVYVIDVTLKNEPAFIKKNRKMTNLSVVKDSPYRFPDTEDGEVSARPVIVGSGPAGLFCAYLLAEHGYRPLLLERGADVDERVRIVDEFWKTGVLSAQTNVQFGEGGAGTFSDGKLNTMVKDTYGRNHAVLDIFVENGAPEEIRYDSKPHIGTDVLRKVVKNMREKILGWGGEVRFHSQLTGFASKEGRVSEITINGEQTMPCGCLVLAIGHSARDTFRMLEGKLLMEPKSFAVGLRMEHPQEMITKAQYGRSDCKALGPANYKVTHQAQNGRGVYSFCMCPGGFVVNASSEPGRLAVNGMSNYARDEKNANSAMIVTVTPDDFPENGPLGGVRFQEHLEELAYNQCGGKIPVQLYGDFCENRRSTGFGEVTPCMKGDFSFGNLREVLPEALSEALMEAIPAFSRKIAGFSREDALFSGVESRTSSPLRILRNEAGEAGIAGIYPCGEGAGYAGGITSAAMDGIKTAEAIAGKYKKQKEE